MPNILDPNVGAGSKKQPMNRDKQKTNHVGRDGNANEKYWECLKKQRMNWMISSPIVYISTILVMDIW